MHVFLRSETESGRGNGWHLEAGQDTDHLAHFLRDAMQKSSSAFQWLTFLLYERLLHYTKLFLPSFYLIL